MKEIKFGLKVEWGICSVIENDSVVGQKLHMLKEVNLLEEIGIVDLEVTVKDGMITDFSGNIIHSDNVSIEVIEEVATSFNNIVTEMANFSKSNKLTTSELIRQLTVISKLVKGVKAA